MIDSRNDIRSMRVTLSRLEARIESVINIQVKAFSLMSEELQSTTKSILYDTQEFIREVDRLYYVHTVEIDRDRRKSEE
jgi:hypothetical protein